MDLIDPIPEAVKVLFGGGLTLGAAKFFIGRTLEDIQEIRKVIGEIKDELAKIMPIVKTVEKHDEILERHEKSITILETKLWPKGKFSH